jgi:molybdopterin synthase sulfur carrier subunit
LIRVKVNFFATVRMYANAKGTSLQLPEGSTARDMIDALLGRFGSAFDDYMVDEDGNLHRHVVVLRNGRGIGILDGLDTKMNDDDSIALLPAIGGG